MWIHCYSREDATWHSPKSATYTTTVKAMQGKCGTITMGVDQMLRFPKEAKRQQMTSEEVKQLFSHGYIWMDYISMPQRLDDEDTEQLEGVTGKDVANFYKDKGGDGESDLVKAVMRFVYEERRAGRCLRISSHSPHSYLRDRAPLQHPLLHRTGGLYGRSRASNHAL